MDTLRDMIEVCAKTDESIKTGKISDRVGVELLLIQFSQK
jgi:DNA polymerase-3 subunit delta